MTPSATSPPTCRAWRRRVHASGGAGLRRAVAIRDRRLLSAEELELVRVQADRAHARLEDFLEVRPVRGVELQWLVRTSVLPRAG